MPGRPGTPHQPGLWGFGGHLWLPGTTNTGNGFGSLTWAAFGNYSDIAPTNGLILQHRRSRYANVVTTPNQQLGLTTGTVASDRMFYRSGAPGVGGYYMAVRFTTNFWKDTQRLFVGMCATGGTMVTGDTPAVGAIGLWHDTTDGQTLSLATFDGAGAVVKSQPTTPSGGISSGLGWLFELWAYDGRTTHKAKLTSMDTLLSAKFWTASPSIGDSTFLAPHVEASNAANTAANDVAIDVISILATNQFG